MMKYLPSIFAGLFLSFLVLFAFSYGQEIVKAAASPFYQTCQQTVSPATTTLASCYNSDGTPRIITGIHIWIPKENTTQTLTLGTSTVNYLVQGNTFGTFAFATSSVGTYYATTTAFASDLNRIWAPSTYFNFSLGTLADASSTGGIVQIDYMGL